MAIDEWTVYLVSGSAGWISVYVQRVGCLFNSSPDLEVPLMRPDRNLTYWRSPITVASLIRQAILSAWLSISALVTYEPFCCQDRLPVVSAQLDRFYRTYSAGSCRRHGALGAERVHKKYIETPKYFSHLLLFSAVLLVACGLPERSCEWVVSKIRNEPKLKLFLA